NAAEIFLFLADTMVWFSLMLICTSSVSPTGRRIALLRLQGNASPSAARDRGHTHSKSTGTKKTVITSVQASEIVRSSPMLAVPGWRDSHSVPKPDAVVAALKSTPRVRLD